MNDDARAQLRSPGAREALAALQEIIPEGELDPARARDLLSEAAAEAGVKKGVMMKSLRAALLGSMQGPDLLATWRLLHPGGADRDRIATSLRQAM